MSISCGRPQARKRWRRPTAACCCYGVYVTSRGAKGTLSVIFLNEERGPVVIETGLGSEGISVTPDGSEVWVVNRAVESISIVDTELLEVVATIGSPALCRAD